jgi:glutathione S-transferase
VSGRRAPPHGEPAGAAGSRQLVGHPFSSYTWKALIAFHETATPFTFLELGPEYPDAGATLAAAWPLCKFPVLLEDGEAIVEASIIVEHVAPGMVPPDRRGAREVRMLDRIFDNYVMSPVQKIVADAMHPPARRDPDEVAAHGLALDTVYRWLDARLAGRQWAAGDAFTLADCAAAPALFYADWVRRIPDTLATLRAYRARALARPSVARCVDEARPYRHLFPLGAPDRD